MGRIAHLTDLHLDGSSERSARFGQALAEAGALGCEHLTLTGDLTSAGRDHEFAELARLLWSWPAHAVTIVPGNHDLGPKSWSEVLSSSELSRFSATSAPGAAIDRGGYVVVALSTQFPRRALGFRASGRVSMEELNRLREISSCERRCTIVAMHHGPQRTPLGLFDGLTNRKAVLQALSRSPSTHVLCGHDHRSLDLFRGRVFCAPSVAGSRDPLRVYEVSGAALVPVKRASRGRYMHFF